MKVYKGPMVEFGLEVRKNPSLGCLPVCYVPIIYATLHTLHSPFMLNSKAPIFPSLLDAGCLAQPLEHPTVDQKIGEWTRRNSDVERSSPDAYTKKANRYGTLAPMSETNRRKNELHRGVGELTQPNP